MGKGMTPKKGYNDKLYKKITIVFFVNQRK